MDRRKDVIGRAAPLSAGSFLPQTQLRAALKAASLALGVPYDPAEPHPEALRLVGAVASRRRALRAGKVAPVRGRRSLPPRLVVRRRKDAKTEILYVADGGIEVSTGYAADQRAHAEVFLAMHCGQREDLAEGCVLPTSVRLTDVVAWWRALNHPAAQATASARDTVTTQSGMASNLLEHLGATVLGEINRGSTVAYARVRGAMLGRTRRHGPAPVSAGTIRSELKFLSQLVREYGAEHGFVWEPYVELPRAPKQSGHALTRGELARLLLGARGWQFDDEGVPVTGMVFDPLGREFYSDDDGRLRFRADAGAGVGIDGEDGRTSGGRWVARPVIDRAARAAFRPMRRLILLGLYTGSRHRVLRTLRWERNGRDGHVVADAAGGFVCINRADVGKGRTRKGCGPCGVAGRLRAHLGPWRTADARIGARTLVHKADGGAYATNLDDLFRKLRDVAKVGAAWADAEDHRYPADGAVNNDAGVHWLRHTCASWMIEGGASAVAVAAFLGMTVKTLHAVYGHVMRDAGGHANAVEALDRAAQDRRL